MCQYSNKITFQISSTVRCCSQGGMTDAHGKPSFGNPMPPLDTRQKMNVSCNWAMVPGSVKLAGMGLKAKA